MTYPPYRPITGSYPEEKWETVAANFIGDLDRCEHGRHAVDDCFSCDGGWSRGNPRARGEDPRLADGRAILGYSLAGRRQPWVLVSPQPTRREDGSLLVELVRVDDES